MSTLITTPNYYLPLPHAGNTLAEDVARLISALVLVDTALDGQQTQITDNDFALPAVNAAGTFSVDGMVLTWLETLNDGRTRSAAYTYLSNGMIDTETVVIGTLQRIVNFNYDLNGRLTGWTTTESAL